MDTLLLPEAGRRRRRYSAAFKAEIVAACLQPGVSTTAVALANQINPNLVRRWIRLQQQSATEPVEPDAARFDSAPAQSAHHTVLVPVLMSDPVALPSQSDESGKTYSVTQRPQHLLQAAPPLPTPPPAEPIRLELRRGDTWLNVTWPASQAEACVRWLRELLP